MGEPDTLLWRFLLVLRRALLMIVRFIEEEQTQRSAY